MSDTNAGAKDVDRDLETARNRIRPLVYQWMSVWDRNTGDAAPLLDLLSPEGFAIELVAEKEILTTIAAVKQWFSRFPKLVKQDNHIVQSIEISPLGEDRWRSVTRIRAVGTSVKDEAFEASSLHDWEVVDYGGQTPRVAKMKIKLVAPSG